MNNVFQFPYVAGPAIALEQLQRFRIGLACGGSPVFLDAMLGKHGNIVLAVTQRRNTQRNDIQPEEQIFAKLSSRDQRPQVIVGGGDDPDTTWNRPLAAGAVDFLSWTGPE